MLVTEYFTITDLCSTIAIGVSVHLCSFANMLTYLESHEYQAKLHSRYIKNKDRTIKSTTEAKAGLGSQGRLPSVQALSNIMCKASLKREYPFLLLSGRPLPS